MMTEKNQELSATQNKIAPQRSPSNMKRNQKRFIPFILATVFMGVILCIMTSQMMQGIADQKRAHETFLPVDAQIVDSSVSKQTQYSNGTHTKSYHAHIKYTYTANGQSYISSRYRFDN